MEGCLCIHGGFRPPLRETPRLEGLRRWRFRFQPILTDIFASPYFRSKEADLHRSGCTVEIFSLKALWRLTTTHGGVIGLSLAAVFKDLPVTLLEAVG